MTLEQHPPASLLDLRGPASKRGAWRKEGSRKEGEGDGCPHFYRAMHFSKRGIAIACRLCVSVSICLSVCPSVCLSVTLVNCDHIGWNSSKIISPLVSLGRSLLATPT